MPSDQNIIDYYFKIGRISFLISFNDGGFSYRNGFLTLYRDRMIFLWDKGSEKDLWVGAGEIKSFEVSVRKDKSTGLDGSLIITRNFLFKNKIVTWNYQENFEFESTDWIDNKIKLWIEHFWRPIQVHTKRKSDFGNEIYEIPWGHRRR